MTKPFTNRRCVVSFFHDIKSKMVAQNNKKGGGVGGFLSYREGDGRPGGGNTTHLHPGNIIRD